MTLTTENVMYLIAVIQNQAATKRVNSWTIAEKVKWNELENDLGEAMQNFTGNAPDDLMCDPEWAERQNGSMAATDISRLLNQ